MKHSTKLLVIIATAVSTVAFAGAGWAYWSSSGSGSGSGSVGTLTAPGKVAGTVASGTVSLSWSASTVSGGGTVKYHVERRPDPGSTWTDVCGSTALAPITGTSCSNAPGAGTYKFRATAVYRSWTQVGSESDPISVVLDTTPPSVTVNQKVGQADPTNTLPILYTVTFSEPVTGFDATDLTRTGSSTGGTVAVTGSAATYEISVSGTPNNGTLGFSVAASRAIDAAGNNNTASTSTDNTVTYDTTPPSVTVNQKVGQADPTNTLPILYTVTFSEPVTGFDATDLTRTGSSTGGTVAVTGSAATYEISVSGTPNNGTLGFSVAASRAIDAAGNNNTASTSTDNTVTYDTVGPQGLTITCSISTQNGNGPCSGSAGNVTGDSPNVTLTITLNGSTVSGYPQTIARTGSTWTTTANLSKGKTYVATIEQQDSAGNTSSATFTINT